MIVLSKRRGKAPPKVDTRAKVVVVTHADGFVEVYGPRTVDARIVSMPHVKHAENEPLAERLVEESLPRRHRAVMLPGLRRAIGWAESWRPATLLVREWRRRVMASILSAGSSNGRRST